MAQVQLKAPYGATSFAAHGEEYMVKDGIITIPEILKPLAESHGYGKAAERADLDRSAIEAAGTMTAEDVAKMSRGDLLIYCDDHRLEVPPRTSIGDLKKLVWSDIEATQKVVNAAAKRK